jgi:hypothetical protein
VASRAAVPIKNPGALRRGLSSHEESSASLRSFASSALKLFSAFLHFCGESCSKLFNAFRQGQTPYPSRSVRPVQSVFKVVDADSPRD